MYHYISTWGNQRKTKYKMISNDEFRLLPIKYPYDIMDSVIRLEFEDTEVSAMSRYDEYLTMIYGDYMTPPDMPQRTPRHSA